MSKTTKIFADKPLISIVVRILRILSKKDKLRAKHLAEQIFLAEQQSGISDVIVGAGFASASKTFTSTKLRTLLLI